MIERIINAFRQGVRPVDYQWLSEWADEKRRIPKGASPEPGRWRTARTPYLKEIMDELSPLSKTQVVCVIKGTQLGITEVANNLIFAVMDQYKGPILMVMPTESVVKKHSKKKITPALKAMPEINAIVKHSRNRGDGGSMFEKEFIGGVLALGWSNTNATFRSDSIQWLILDDVDGFPDDVDGEGSPIELAKNRTDSFGSKRKIFINSTPTIAGKSNIEKEFADSDQRHYYMPCPFCTPRDKSKQNRSNMVRFEWEYFKFDYDENYNLKGDVHFSCPHCGSLIGEHYKTWMMDPTSGAKWIPHNPGHQHRGYRIPSFYSPIGWVTWEQITREFLKALKQMETEHKTTLMKRWKNTRAAQVWEEETLQVSEKLFDNRCEEYPADVPKEVKVLTAGVDTQDDRFEIEVVGWGDWEETWSIDYKIIQGDPKDPETRKRLDEYLMQTFEVEGGGRLKIYATAIDRGGHRSKYIDEFCRGKLTRRIFAVFGSKNANTPAVPVRSSKSKYKMNIFRIGVNEIKNDVYAKIMTTTPGPNYMHFPKKPAYNSEYFKQLTAERRKQDGSWEKKRERNEALDCRVYATAALMLAGIDISKISGKDIKFGNAIVEQKKPRRKKRRRSEMMEDII